MQIYKYKYNYLIIILLNIILLKHNVFHIKWKIYFIQYWIKIKKNLICFFLSYLSLYQYFKIYNINFSSYAILNK